MNKARLFGILMVAGGIASANAAQVTFTSWGGSYQDAEAVTAAAPFTAQTGIKVRSDTYNGGIAQIRSQVETNNVVWDVVDLQLADATRACDEGLLEKANVANLAPAKDGTPARFDYLPGSLSECMVGNIAWSTLVAYNKDKFKNGEPKKIADFFDLKKFPGRRGLRKSPEGALEWALLADGVSPRNVYKVLATPDGLNRAFRKLDTIKASVVWWESGAQPPQLLADGEVAMTSAYNARIYTAIVRDKKPFAFLWDGQVKNVEGYAIVKGSKNMKEAVQFIRYATQPGVLAKLGSMTAYGPLRKSSHALMDARVAPYLPTTPANQAGAIDVDVAFWADHADDLNQKFAVWLARK